MTNKFFDHRLITALFTIAGAFVVGGFTWTFFGLRAVGGNSFILHFNDLGGITIAGGSGFIIFMGIFGAVVTVMNYFIAREFDARDRFFGKFLAAMTLVFAVLLFIAFAAILTVNV